jgi:hypothetical protein
MTNPDPVDIVVEAYLDHLEHGAPKPSLGHLSEDDRVEAAELIELMRDGRGIDFYLPRPSLESLLTGTEFEAWLAPATDGRRVEPS